MLHIPILRLGKPYESVDKIEIVHHATGAAVATVSQANSGMIVRDVNRWEDRALERLNVAELIAISGKAAELFIGATLPLGDTKQSFEDYVRQLSATTGMPQTLCRANAEKIRKVMAEINVVLAGLTRGLDFSVLDRGYGTQAPARESVLAPSTRGAPSREPQEGVLATGTDEKGFSSERTLSERTISFSRQARTFGAVLPSNSPGVHSLWIPAIALKTPVVLKPGREEPWSPYRIIQAFIAAGAPAEAFGFYPTDHGGAAELLRVTDRSMLFGDASTTKAWAGDPRVELHGPGYSKIVFDDACAEYWKKHLDVLTTSIAANGGRSCINASGIWTPKHGREIAEAVAKELANVQALPADHPDAKVAAFANPQFAEAISGMIDQGLREPGAVDLTQQFRGSPRLVKVGRIAYLLPTIVWCEDREHPLANREFLFPFASVVECPANEMPQAIGSSLIVSAITRDQNFIAALMAARNIDRLNIGPIPTFRISWDQPHEGNLFEHLYRQRAFQMEPAA